jgi:hypothetical protein
LSCVSSCAIVTRPFTSDSPSSGRRVCYIAALKGTRFGSQSATHPTKMLAEPCCDPASEHLFTAAAIGRDDEACWLTAAAATSNGQLDVGRPAACSVRADHLYAGIFHPRNDIFSDLFDDRYFEHRGQHLLTSKARRIPNTARRVAEKTASRGSDSRVSVRSVTTNGVTVDV